MRKLEDIRPQQTKAIDFLYRGDQSLLLAGVGTGKTAMILLLLQQYWIPEGISDGCVMVGPKRVCTDVWRQEVDEWEPLQGSITVECAAGENEATRRQMLEGDADVVCVNYEQLIWMMNAYPDGIPGRNVIVFDEVDKLKDHTSKRFKGVTTKRAQREGFYSVGIQDWREVFEIHIGMTATPASNNLLEMWAEMFVIDGGARLGDNYYDFRKMHFYQDDWAGYKYRILPGREEYIYDQIADITHRVPKNKNDGTPEVIELPPRIVELNSDARAIYAELNNNYLVYLRKKRDDPKSITAVEAANAGVLYGKLRQMAAGFLYLKDEGEKDNTAQWYSYAKFQELDSLISELQGEQLMVVYHFGAQRDELLRRFEQANR